MKRTPKEMLTSRNRTEKNVSMARVIVSCWRWICKYVIVQLLVTNAIRKFRYNIMLRARRNEKEMKVKPATSFK